MNESLFVILFHLGWLAWLSMFLTWAYGTKNMRTCIYQFFHPFKTLQTPKQRAFLLITLVSLLLGSIAVVTRYKKPDAHPDFWSVGAGTVVNAMAGTDPYTFYLKTTAGRVYSTLITEEGVQKLIGQHVKEVMQLADGRIILELSGGGALLVTRIDR